MKLAYTILLLFVITITMHSQNSSRYEAPPYFPEMPYDGILSEVDSMITYRFEAPQIHRDSVKKNMPPLGGCWKIKRQYFDENGRRTLFEHSNIDDKGLLQVIFREATQRDDESLPTSRSITQDGITTHYILENRNYGQEIYKANLSQKEMIVDYDDYYTEFDMGEGQVETEITYEVTTTINDPSGLLSTTIEEYSEDGFCYRIIKKDANGNQIFNSDESVDPIERLESYYTAIIEEDERGNYAILGVYSLENVLLCVDKTEFFYREKISDMDEE